MKRRKSFCNKNTRYFCKCSECFLLKNAQVTDLYMNDKEKCWMGLI